MFNLSFKETTKHYQITQSTQNTIQDPINKPLITYEVPK